MIIHAYSVSLFVSTKTCNHAEFYTLKVAYWISAGLLSRKSWVQTPNKPTLRVLK